MLKVSFCSSLFTSSVRYAFVVFPPICVNIADLQKLLGIESYVFVSFRCPGLPRFHDSVYCMFAEQFCNIVCGFNRCEIEIYKLCLPLIHQND